MWHLQLFRQDWAQLHDAKMPVVEQDHALRRPSNASCRYHVGDGNEEGTLWLTLLPPVLRGLVLAGAGVGRGWAPGERTGAPPKLGGNNYMQPELSMRLAMPHSAPYGLHGPFIRRGSRSDMFAHYRPHGDMKAFHNILLRRFMKVFESLEPAGCTPDTTQ